LHGGTIKNIVIIILRVLANLRKRVKKNSEDYLIAIIINNIGIYLRVQQNYLEFLN
jgi:protein required for attachment to host cells